MLPANARLACCVVAWTAWVVSDAKRWNNNVGGVNDDEKRLAKRNTKASHHEHQNLEKVRELKSSYEDARLAVPETQGRRPKAKYHSLALCSSKSCAVSLSVSATVGTGF